MDRNEVGSEGSFFRLASVVATVFIFFFLPLPLSTAFYTSHTTNSIPPSSLFFKYDLRDKNSKTFPIYVLELVVR